MKRIMSIIIMVALVLAQTNTVGAAFTVDVTEGPFTASATITGTPTAILNVNVKTLAGGNASTIGWTGVNTGDGWKLANNYLEIAYEANQSNWGVQIFTDNLSPTADPKYDGDPTQDLGQQPVGLVGVSNRLITCPMAVLVMDERITNPNPATNADFALPNEVETNPGTPAHSIHFDTGYNEIAETTGPVKYEKVWFWMKDKSGTKWVADTDNDGNADPSELDSSFSATRDDYATIVTTFGTSSGWVNPNTNKMQRDASSTSPICVYIAAKFKKANELQEYKTNTLSLELYHE